MALRFRTMPTVQIKNVPPDVHQTLRRRAAQAGQSLQEYTLALLSDHACKPTLEEVFAQIDQRSGGWITMREAAEWIRAERDARS
jgi:plasmid stability protein